MSSEKEKMLNGELYDPTDPELVADRNRARDLTRRYNNTIPDDQAERQKIVEELFCSVGNECQIEPPFRCDYGYNINIDENFYSNFDCVILDAGRVEIGRNCMIAPGVHIYTATIRSTRPSESKDQSTLNRLRSVTTSGLVVRPLSIPA